MKISTIIFGLFFLISFNNSQDRVESLDIFQETTAGGPWNSYYKVPYYEGKMFLTIKSSSNDYDYLDSSVCVASFPWEPSDEQLVDKDKYYKFTLGTTYYGCSGWEYPLSPEYPETKYFGIRVEVKKRVEIRVNIKEKNHVFPMNQTSRIGINDPYGSYYFKIPAFGNNKIIFKLSLFEPLIYYSPKIQIFFKGFKKIPNDDEIRNDSKGWTILEKYDTTSDHQYCIYSYPLEISDKFEYFAFNLTTNYCEGLVAYLSPESDN